MNLLYISNEYPPETGYGGIGTYTKHCAEGMAARGHRVHVLCRSESGEPYTTTAAGVIVHRISPGSYPTPSGRFFFPLRKFCYRAIPECLIRLAWAKQALNSFQKEFSGRVQIDIIEYPECGGEGFYIAALPGIVKIVRLHTPWEMVRKLDRLRQPLADRYLLSRLERSAARRASYATSPTQALADILKHLWRLPDCIVIPNPIPISEFTATEGNDLLFLGRIEYRKGVHLLIEAYSSLCRRINPPRLRLVGKPYGRLPDGADYGDHITRLIAAVPDNGVVEWIQGVRAYSVIDYLRKSSIAILPSLWENLSYACLEAMASGCAVIATKCGGFPEMITHGKTGLLVESSNVAVLTDALTKLISQPELARTIGKNARTHVLNTYDSAIVCAQIETMYLGFLKQRRLRASK